MAEKPGHDKNKVEGDPERGDAILRRMLRTKPKPHKDMAKGRQKEETAQATPGSPNSGKKKPTK